MQNNLGRLTFLFGNFRDVKFQVTTKGKLGIYYPQEITIEKCLERVKPYLVKADGSPAKVISEIREADYPSAKAPIDLSLLERVEKELGSEIDLSSLREWIENLDSLLRAGAKISSREAEKTKEEIESTFDRIEISMNGDDPHLFDKCNRLDAVKNYLRLLVDSLVKE